VFRLIIPGLLAVFALAQSDDGLKLKNLPAGENILWQDPGNVETLDFVDGVGGRANRPQGPFQFIEEDMSGTSPKVKVKDGRGVVWSVKFGQEAKPSTFATRFVWACGYTVETEYLIARAQIVGAHGLKRAAGSIQGDGYFSDARFQLRSDHPKFLTDHNWAWTSNPFLGTPQLSGLKILVMLLSNWDTKDARDFSGSGAEGTADSNLAIFQGSGRQDTGQKGPRYLYFVSDWGASLGKWGSVPGARSKWDCKSYAAQTSEFVRGKDNGFVRWGYSGKHSDDITKDIRVTDVQWLMQYLGRVTDGQIRRGLAASGAAPEEMDCYLRAIRQRITQLQGIAK
jgi:hypothetical protein